MIDWNKPYGKICGELEDYPNARYTQDGKYYRVNGEEVGLDEDQRIPENKKTTDEELGEKELEKTEDSNGEAAEVTLLEDMHWKKLKLMVEEAGGNWTNKVDAIEYLRNGDVS